MRTKRKNKLLIFLTAVLVFAVFATPLSASFGDVSKRHWAYDVANYAAEKGLMQGTGSNRFEPETTTSRATFVTVLARQKGADLSAYTTTQFKDVDIKEWYGASVQWAFDKGIVKGYSNDFFGPNDSITREDMMTMLYSYAKFDSAKDTTTIDFSVLNQFSDKDKIDSWAKEATAWCIGNKIINGVGNGVLSPRSNSNRAQIAKILKVYITGDAGSYTPVRPVAGLRTLKNYLNIALEPVGNCMYIWGGGWVGSDTNRIGVNPNWKVWADQQTSAYNHKNYRYKYGYGLDCSGYIGWVTYNTLNTTSGNSGYVTISREMASTFAKKGFGTYTDKANVTTHKVGDIMSSTCSDGCRHVWISLGQCSDGSVVLVHSSPQGVRIAGTIFANLPEDYEEAIPESYKTEAVKLAEYYMSKYYADWYARYPNCYAINTYNTHFSAMSWNLNNGVLSDPEAYVNMTPQQVLTNLIGN